MASNQDWTPTDGWRGAYDKYPPEKCPRCGCKSLEFGTREQIGDYFSIPGNCPTCGLSFRETLLAEAILEGCYEDYHIVVDEVNG